jgi:predicted  nucleic acid-binding Zn-ribbon protein
MTFNAAALRELHRIHRQLADLRERLDRGPKQIKARQAAVAGAEEKLAKVQADQKAARIAVDQKQLSLRSGEGKIIDLKAKLNACSTNREYQALKDQIAADEMANSVLADEILEALEMLDQFKPQITEAQQQIEKGKQELAKVQETVRGQEETLKTDVHRLEQELTEAEKALPDDYRDAYNRVVKARGQDAMAQVEGESCGGCYQQLTPNIMSQLAAAKAVFCKTCGRLLYLPEDRTPGRK